MSTENSKYDITGGPSKFDLMLGLFDNTATNRRFVYFALNRRGGGGVDIALTAVGAEDGSGESWIIEGNCKTTNQKVKGHYLTKTRLGWLEFIDNITYG